MIGIDVALYLKPDTVEALDLALELANNRLDEHPFCLLVEDREGPVIEVGPGERIDVDDAVIAAVHGYIRMVEDRFLENKEDEDDD